MNRILPILLTLTLLGSPQLHAQFAAVVELPDASPAASATTTVAATDFALHYNSPAARGRTIWGEVVPWDEVWRAGANLNTRLSASTDFSVEGKALPAGTYGLHVIPRKEGPWTVILSRTTTAWGSEGYTQAEDALRVEVQPVAAVESFDDLTYYFDRRSEDAVTLVLAWGTQRLPVRLGVDLQKTMVAHLKNEMRGLAQFSWIGTAQAARYLHNHGWEPQLALQWVDLSLAANQNMNNLLLKSDILAGMGQTAEAAKLKAEALAVGDLNGYAQLLGELLGTQKYDEGLSVAQTAVKRFPDSYRPLAWVAQVYQGQQKKKEALSWMDKALAKAPADRKARLQTLRKQMEQLPG